MARTKSEKITVKVKKAPARAKARPVPTPKLRAPAPRPDSPDAPILDGGFTRDMHRPGEVFHPETPVSSGKVRPEPAAREEDTLYETDEDFYSSKLEPDRKSRPDNTASRHRSSSTPQTDWSVLGFLLFLLVATVIAAWVGLQQLEQAGSGLIW